MDRKVIAPIFLMVILISCVVVLATEGYVQEVFPIELQTDQEPKYAFSFTASINHQTQQFFVLLDVDGSYKDVFKKIVVSINNYELIKFKTKVECGVNQFVCFEPLENANE